MSLREATALMADDAPITPPPALRDSVLAGIKNIRPIPPKNDSPPEAAGPAETGSSDEGDAAVAPVLPMRRRRRRIAALVATAAAILAIAGGVAFQPWQDDSSRFQSQISAADQVLAAADVKKVSIDFDDGSKATVFHSPKREASRCWSPTTWPHPRPGRRSSSGSRTKSGAMTPAGLMKNAGDHKVLLEGDASEATGVGITVEPESGSEQPTSEPIALFELDKGQA